MSYVAARDGRKNRSAAGRAPSVPTTIEGMHGQSVGILQVPHHMAAGHPSRRRYDLADPVQCRNAYQQILCEASCCNEVEDLINPALLRQVWRDLHLPSKVREAWETRHPGLRRRTVARSPGGERTVVTRVSGDRTDVRGVTRPGRSRSTRVAVAR
ncbi:hypothetical protein [Actinoplanes sp. NBRC 101535]|uniref:hypothetical protein n=1 Tax=Actinoplanes sp. NBRC 101535 TaxID=3032196 RepID=UPI0024A59482|nr:hypothetical protein [Actinoplanes sp. NBRC 101535]GLY04159.1 hypothetical protein Acsp01_45380 [Actinoplanes sp. NBRC 101535]